MPKKFSKDAKTIARRRRVIHYLEDQLLTSTKNVTTETGTVTQVLTDADKKRIQKELEILNSRI